MNPTAVFVTSYNSLAKCGGGVQTCTADFTELLSALFNLQLVPFDVKRSLVQRVIDRFAGHHPRELIPAEVEGRIEEVLKNTSAEVVFFNLLEPIRTVRFLRQKYGSELLLIHLSHGLDSTDLSADRQFHRRRQESTQPDRKSACYLGQKIQREADYRRFVDASICIAPLDAELERWLGVAYTLWLSRPVRCKPLVFSPVKDRVGCVATLDHPPNRNGLTELFEALSSRPRSQLRFRLIGSPPIIGCQFAKEFAFVDYLGGLSDSEVEAEIATWCAFVHPVFAYARGASTKIGHALGWGLPIVTTADGVRGYVWDETLQPLYRTPHALAQAAVVCSNVDAAMRGRAATLALAALQPTRDDCARRLRTFISQISRE